MFDVQTTSDENLGSSEIFAEHEHHAAANQNNIVDYSVLNLNQDKATKPQTVQIVRQGEATPYWLKLIHYKLKSGQGEAMPYRFKVNPLYLRIFNEYPLALP